MSRAKKRYGQHFLHDRGTIERIVNAVDPRPGERVVEVGPGRGAISASLLSRAGRLDAIEIDPDVVPGLTARCEGLGQLVVHLADALEFDFRALRGDGPPLRLVGNLPYNVSTPLLFHFVSQIDAFASMHFMLQKEVVTRMAAAPGGKDYGRLTVMLQKEVVARMTAAPSTPEYGRLTVMLQATFAVERLFVVPPGAFRPPPKVDSAVARLTPLREHAPAIDDRARFAAIVAAAFSQRRKTLRNALGERVDAAQYARAGVDPQRRGETLSIDEFVALANAGPGGSPRN